MIDNDQHFVGQGHDCLLLAMSASHAVVEGRQIVVFGVGDGPSHFEQDCPKIGIPFGCLAAESLPPALLVPRADPSPGSNMFVGSKARHICTNLCKNTSSRCLFN